jgi:tetratricopeptide (TPR) repeat protein
MECPYCKEEIKDGAKKCKFCGEILGSRGRLKNLTSVLGGLLSILIPIGSLFIAYLEHQGRVQAVQEKVIVEQEAERDKKATQDILRQIPAEFISRQAARDLRPSGEPEFETVPPDEESQRTAGQIKELVSEGNRALAGGDADRAEQFYREAETIEKASPQVQQITKQYVPKSLGYVYLQKGEPEKAIEEFKKALERDPDDKDARKGLIYAKTLAEKQRR